MNTAELITKLKDKFYDVDEAGLHKGDTIGEITVWQIRVFNVVDDVMNRLTLTFYTKGDNAFWGNSEPNPTIPVSEPRFIDRVNVFIASKISDGTIMFGYILEISELTQKALVAAKIGTIDKEAIITENADGNFSIEVL